VDDPFSPTGIEVTPRVDVVASDEQTEVDVDVDRWAALAVAVLEDHGRSGELTLTFVDRDEIAALNAEHLGKEGPTDVLAFPLDDEPSSIEVGPVLLGDVVVCPSVAHEAAVGHAGTAADELALLTVHGVLHILGHDHAEADERAVMRKRELELLIEHHWGGPVPSTFQHEQVES
jgi:probable rRNA maturation factor